MSKEREYKDRRLVVDVLVNGQRKAISFDLNHCDAGQPIHLSNCFVPSLDCREVERIKQGRASIIARAQHLVKDMIEAELTKHDTINGYEIT